ncbi:hypothetical protein NC796_08695 [Aliifodinibius sp. S!AR15-10]|uniref:hypothetical protein n=1 Tax=Aliifodinibius sp. S!AR15-10 TaxID=2950437 RepID=UPI00286788B2|nr:hypothetical protein [Aliifodinibius sp. S!AR15-10]MDR8391213.1 hypothetical protein [Aliifodinibius sp. S!AR15-10]
MNKTSKTYRLIAILTGLLLVAGISTPTAIAKYCGMSDHAAASVEHHEHHSEQHKHHSDNAGDTDCDLGFNCSCCVDQSVVNRATNTLTRVKADIITTVIDILDQTDPATTSTQFTYLHTEAGDSSPPIFLKNSSFLN